MVLATGILKIGFRMPSKLAIMSDTDIVDQRSLSAHAAESAWQSFAVCRRQLEKLFNGLLKSARPALSGRLGRDQERG